MSTPSKSPEHTAFNNDSGFTSAIIKSGRGNLCIVAFCSLIKIAYQNEWICEACSDKSEPTITSEDRLIKLRVVKASSVNMLGKT